VSGLGYAAAKDTYWQAGWRGILLLGHDSKWPPPAGFTGHDGVDPSYADVCSWAEQDPGGNLALRLADDTIGIDVDAYDNKTGAATLTEAEHRWGRLPATYRSTSRDDNISGIRLYRVPAGTQLAGKIAFPDLGCGDIEIVQHHHRYAMAWPSVHPSGRPYRWIAEIDGSVVDYVPAPGDLPELPAAWLTALRTDTSNDEDLRNALRKFSSFHTSAESNGEVYDVTAAATEGEQSPKVRRRLIAAYGDLAEGLSRHDHTLAHVLALLRYGKDGEPGVKNALLALRQVYVNTVGPDRAGGYDEARSEFQRMIYNPRAAKLLGAAEPSLLEQRAVNGAWLGAQDFAPLEYAVDGLIPEGLGILVGPPKKGKSFLVADVGLAVAAGGSALGAIPTSQRPVLYLALEDGHRRLKSRFGRILDRQPIPAGIEVVIKASPKEALLMIAEFFDRHRDAKPLVILDTLGKVRPAKRPGDDAYQADYATGTTLKELVDAVPGASLLVVHHTRKAEALDFVDSVSGTQGIAGSVDFVMVLDRKRHTDDAVLSVTGRDVPEGEYALTAQYGILWRLDGRNLTEARRKVHERRETNNLGERQSGLLEFVNSRTQTTSADAAAKLGTTPKLAGDALRALYDRGRIRRVKRGVYGPNTVESAESAERAGQNVLYFPTPSAESVESDD